MELALTPQANMSPLEAMLSIYTPILECLVSHLPTQSKLCLSQASRYLRTLLYSYPPFFAHLDFRLQVFESTTFDSYRLGTVYNLDCLLQTLPVEGRIVSLTLDWTAVSGQFLFNKIMDRCQHTLEHLSVRGCRKVSIKHHIVPHFVYQEMVEPLSRSPLGPPKRALKSLYVYKARGVRRKPFLIDRKPADGDEPSRYLTTLAEKLGIWLDLGLCPTPKLRCPRRRDILRRGKEKFCVPFDKRWRVQDTGSGNPARDPSAPLSPVEQQQRQHFEQTQGDGILCDNCAALIPDRCEACVHQMTCSHCAKALCHECAYMRPSPPQPAPPATDDATAAAIAAVATAAADVNLPLQWAGLAPVTVALPPPAATATAASATDNADAEPEATVSPSHLLRPCCETAPFAHADILCSTCYASTTWASCDGCQKQLCIKHELERCRRCAGGCDRIFCFSSPESSTTDPGCGELESGKAAMKDCLSCGIEVCGTCRLRNYSTSCSLSSSSSTASSDTITASSVSDDGTSSSASSLSPSPAPPPEKSACACKVCIEHYYCPSCWPTKPMPCEPRPAAILAKKILFADTPQRLALYQVSFLEREEKDRWYTYKALQEFHADAADDLLDEFAARQRMQGLDLSSGTIASSASFAPQYHSDDDEDVSSAPYWLPQIHQHHYAPNYTRQPGEADILGIPDELIEVAEREFVLHKILACKPPATSTVSNPTFQQGHATAGEIGCQRNQTRLLCKWLGRNVAEVTWEGSWNGLFEQGRREAALVKEFLEAHVGEPSGVPVSAAGGGGSGSGARPGDGVVVAPASSSEFSINTALIEIEDDGDLEDEGGGAALI